MIHQVSVKRVYEPAEPADGHRVLVDRLWPRGMRREALPIDAWVKDIAPSGELRRWFHAHPDQYGAFSDRFRAELSTRPEARMCLEDLSKRLLAGPVTLLTAARAAPNHATVLQHAILERAGRGS